MLFSVLVSIFCLRSRFPKKVQCHEDIVMSRPQDIFDNNSVTWDLFYKILERDISHWLPSIDVSICG